MFYIVFITLCFIFALTIIIHNKVMDMESNHATVALSNSDKPIIYIATNDSNNREILN